MRLTLTVDVHLHHVHAGRRLRAAHVHAVPRPHVVAGIDDALVGEPDLPAALEGTGRPVILLAHNPDVLFDAVRAGVDLQLSGHTHGGQFGLGSWLRSFVQPFQSGLYKYKNTQLYVSNGAGYVGPPVRLGAPSEISLLKLTDAGRGSIFLKSGRSNSGREN